MKRKFEKISLKAKLSIAFAIAILIFIVTHMVAIKIAEDSATIAGMIILYILIRMAISKFKRYIEICKAKRELKRELNKAVKNFVL